MNYLDERNKMESQKSQYVTYKEIITQTEAWTQALEIVESKENRIRKIFNNNFNEIIFTGCGSTHYLSLSAASLFQKISGIRAIGCPASELLVYPESNYNKNSSSLLIAVSRSGESTETVSAVNRFIQNGRGSVITITNNENSALASMGDENLIISAGREQGIAQTRAFTSMFVGATAMPIILFYKEELFDMYKKVSKEGSIILQKYESFVKNIGENQEFDRFYILGSGARYGLACEANLKLKEMSLTHSEPFHFLEFRHGPKSMVTDSTVIIGFVSKSHAIYEYKVLEEMKTLGAKIISICQGNGDIILPNYLREDVINVLYLPLIQLMAYYRSTSKGLNPDQPNNLDMVVELE